MAQSGIQAGEQEQKERMGVELLKLWSRVTGLDEKSQLGLHTRAVLDRVQGSAAARGHDLDSIGLDEDFGALRILSAAAALHNVGFPSAGGASVDPSVSQHASRSAELAAKLLASDSEWSVNDRGIELVCSLISELPSIRLRYPSPEREGLSIDVQSLTDSPTAGRLLPLLQEAEALSWLDPTGIDLIEGFGRRKGLPLVPSVGAGGMLPSWDGSVAGNLRVFVKAAMSAVRSKEGLILLRTRYRQAEELIRRWCDEQSVLYEAELSSLDDMLSAVEQLRQKQLPRAPHVPARFALLGAAQWEEFAKMVRAVKLEGDPGFAVYPHATLRSSLMQIDDVCPTAKYALTSLLQRAKALRSLVLSVYGYSTLDLAGLLLCRWGVEDEFSLAPPFLERETSEKGGGQLLLLDGLHRVREARERGISAIRFAVIEGASTPFPVTSVAWSQIATRDSVPNAEEKRNYRFVRAKDIEALGLPLGVEVTDQNAKHLLYRNLRQFGSLGVRPSEVT